MDICIHDMNEIVCIRMDTMWVCFNFIFFTTSFGQISSAFSFIDVVDVQRDILDFFILSSALIGFLTSQGVALTFSKSSRDILEVFNIHTRVFSVFYCSYLTFLISSRIVLSFYRPNGIFIVYFVLMSGQVIFRFFESTRDIFVVFHNPVLAF